VPVLVYGHSGLVRPIAGGAIALVGGDRPVTLDTLRERLVAVCARPSDRDELTQLVAETDRRPPAEVAASIDELIDAGLLRLV